MPVTILHLGGAVSRESGEAIGYARPAALSPDITKTTAKRILRHHNHRRIVSGVASDATSASRFLPSGCSPLSEQPPLGVGEAEALAIQARAQHAVLSAQVSDRLALLASDPAGDQQNEELKRSEGHGHRPYQSSATSRELFVTLRSDQVWDSTGSTRRR
jgi:hypothetical protein